MDIVGSDLATSSGTTAEAPADDAWSLPAAAVRADEQANGAIVPLSATWPTDVELILSAMDVGRGDADETPVIETALNRRHANRTPYRVRACLKLFSDRPGAGPWTLYTRDVSPRGVGFITPHRLPLGYGGWVEIPAPRGGLIQIHCTLYRCRPAVQGWFEGALSFNREQHAFDRPVCAG